MSRFTISYLYDMRKGVISISQQGHRHKTGLQSYNPNEFLHKLFTMLCASPPLDPLKFQDISNLLKNKN